MHNNKIKISRNQQLLKKLVIVNGFPGCGKTMLSPIVSSFSHVEMMQYAPVIEQMCELSGLGRVDDDVAESMIRMNADLLTYNVLMGRNSNCRPGDLSSIFKHKPVEHIRRMLGPGDEAILDIVQKNRHILHLTTHMLLPHSKLLFNAFDNRLVFIEVVRHPLYMIIQQEKNFKMFGGPRNQHISYSHNDKEYSFFSHKRERKFDKGNSFEKAIHSIDWYYSKLFSKNYDDAVFIVPFEKFVKNPDYFMKDLSFLLGSPLDKKVYREMSKQKVPRKHLSDSPALNIYKKCGWKPPLNTNEEGELKVRRELVKSNVSAESMDILDSISDMYLKTFIKNSNSL
jgi:hypothetical protein